VDPKKDLTPFSWVDGERENMDLSPIFQTAGEALAAYNEVSRADAGILLAACLGRSRAQILARPEASIAAAAARRFAALMERRARGEPIAYLLGEKEFWSLPLKVTRDVLVPRPETETLVEAALAACPADQPLEVLDLGTGSGAIALALARERARWRVTATDESAAALAVARENAQRLGLERVELLAGRWFEPLGARRFDLIASNPPYVAEGDPALAVPELTFEPRSALVAGPTGLEALREIIAAAPAHLRRGGRLLLEHGHDQALAVRELLESAGFSTIASFPDLAGHERVTSGKS
jgi:release factor glutamine methyltransferase